MIREKVDRASVAWGVADIVFGALLAIVVLRGLPARALLVDVPGLVLSAAFVLGGLGLLVGAPFAKKVMRVATIASCAFGGLVTILLVWSMAFLAGVHAPVGGGGILLGVLVLLLVLPYLVVFPFAEYAWLTRQTSPAPKKDP